MAARSTELKLGKLLLRTRAILSPLEGVSDVGFRNLNHGRGASLTWTEMVRAQAVSRENSATLDLIDTFDPKTPTGVQLLAKSPEELLSSLKVIEKLALSGERPHYNNIAAIDINFGCPSPDVIREGAGPALLKRRKRLGLMLAQLQEWKETTRLPNIGAVGCKIRLGLNSLEQSSKVYLRVVEAANESGIDYLVVHARHAKQRSRDLPTWSAIKEVKSIANMPVIGNGDVTSYSEARRMMTETGCDGVMIARAAIRNPWVFNSFLLSTTAAATAANPVRSSSSASKSAYEPLVPASTFSDIRAAVLGNSVTEKEEGDTSIYWPTIDEINKAEADYMCWATKHQTKGKYLEFHRTNFERLKKIALTGDVSLKVLTPRVSNLM